MPFAPVIFPRITSRHKFISADELSRPPDSPPIVDIFGITQALIFTVDTDKAFYKLYIPDDWYPETDIRLSVLWTRSSSGTDDSGKTVRWQIKYHVFNLGDNVVSSGKTLYLDDVYESSSTTDQIVYITPEGTIPSTEINRPGILSFELMAVTPPMGLALSKPACLGLRIDYTSYQVPPIG